MFDGFAILKSKHLEGGSDAGDIVFVVGERDVAILEPPDDPHLGFGA